MKSLKFPVLIAICNLAISESYLSLQENVGLVLESQNGIVNASEEIVYTFNFSELENAENLKIRVRTSVVMNLEQMNAKIPIMFTVRQRSAVTSWQLPVVFYSDIDNSRSVFEHEAERVLCFDPNNDKDRKNIQVVVFTQSLQSLNFQVKVNATPYDYIIKPNTSLTMSLASLSSDFFLFKFGDRLSDLAMVKINSSDSSCILVSIQPPQCPIYASEADVQFHGRWMTVSNAAGLTISRADFPTGFYIIFVALKSNLRCEQYQGIIPPKEMIISAYSPIRYKSIRFEVLTHLTNSRNTFTAISLPMLIYLVVISAVLGVFVYFHRVKLEIVQSSVTPTSVVTADQNETVFQKYLKKFRSPVKVYDLIKMDITRLEKKSKRFYWSIMIVSVFYLLPVCQLAFIYLKVVNRTGDEDLCYYNFLCAHPYGYFKDFNHIYSNIGYVMFGFIFILLVRIKHSRLKNLTEGVNDADIYQDELELDELARNGNQENRPMESDTASVTTRTSIWLKFFPDIVKSRDYGVFYHFGLFYAMGIALILQGFLSGVYHVCPTQTNFQFDASFMYVLVILTIVKLYQFRHPIYVNANVVFVSLAFIAIWAYLGLELNNSQLFKVAFTIFHTLCIFNLLLYQYYVGYLRINGVVVTSIVQVYQYAISKLKHLLVFHELRTFRRQTVLMQTSPMVLQSVDYTPNRALLPTLAVIFNLLITILNFTTMSDRDFASQVLAILIINSVVYFVYYILMKSIHQEYKRGMWIQTLIYSVVAMCLWVPSCMYFSMALTSWESAPAQSRIRNGECFLMDMYDYHDVWHFLSAPAMFCSFLVLLTIDDDLIGTPKSEIAVF